MIQACLMKNMVPLISCPPSNQVALAEATKSHCPTSKSQRACMACPLDAVAHITNRCGCIVLLQLGCMSLEYTHRSIVKECLRPTTSMPTTYQTLFCHLWFISLNYARKCRMHFIYMSYKVNLGVWMIKSSIFLSTYYLQQ